MSPLTPHSYQTIPAFQKFLELGQKVQTTFYVTDYHSSYLQESTKGLNQDGKREYRMSNTAYIREEFLFNINSQYHANNLHV